MGNWRIFLNSWPRVNGELTNETRAGILCLFKPADLTGGLLEVNQTRVGYLVSLVPERYLGT